MERRFLPFVIYVTSFPVFLIGCAIPFWLYDGSLHYGLWFACSDFDSQSCFSLIDPVYPDWFKAVQAMEVLGLIAGIGGLGLCFLGTFVKPQNRMIRVFSGLAGLAAAGLIMIGVIIYGTKLKYHLHAGFGLAIVGSLGLGLAGLLSFVIKGSDNRTPQQTGFSGQAVGFGGHGGTGGVIISPGTHGTTAGPGAYPVTTQGYATGPGAYPVTTYATTTGPGAYTVADPEKT